MSQELNSIIDQLANIDSASAKICRKLRMKKPNMLTTLARKSKAFDPELRRSG